ncbi:hypothetical protein TWF730_001898 [Orbilia blumenaviensis]|uniref:Uncharacterized protein n=1 Tax=Orbilia blumenaviensis TaxID=1796055 RepID=A0AAV9UDC6_9PEZI
MAPNPKRVKGRPASDVTGSPPARRGRGRPLGSRSRSRTGDPSLPARRHGRVTRSQTRLNGTNSVSPSPTRRRGRPPGSRNQASTENVRPERVASGSRNEGGRHLTGTSGTRPQSQPHNFSWPNPANHGIRVPAGPPLDPQAARRGNAPDIPQMVNNMFAELHHNGRRTMHVVGQTKVWVLTLGSLDLNWVSENLWQMNLSRDPNVLRIPQPHTLGQPRVSPQGFHSPSPPNGTSLAYSQLSVPPQAEQAPPRSPEIQSVHSSGELEVISPVEIEMPSGSSPDVTPAPDAQDWQLVPDYNNPANIQRNNNTDNPPMSVSGSTDVYLRCVLDAL